MTFNTWNLHFIKLMKVATWIVNYVWLQLEGYSAFEELAVGVKTDISCFVMLLTGL